MRAVIATVENDAHADAFVHFTRAGTVLDPRLPY
jgi:hypothetical protein